MIATARIEAIHRIHDIEHDVIMYYIRQAENSLRKSGRKIGTYKGADLFIAGDAINSWLVFQHEGNTLYVIKSKRKSLGRSLYGQQVIAARNPYMRTELARTTGFAVHAFKNIYLKQYDAIVSSHQMTDRGFLAFSNAVEAAFRRRKFIYLYDERRTPITLTRVESRSDYTSKGDWIFDSESGNQMRLIVISNKELK